jgi:hypothetical protein
MYYYGRSCRNQISTTLQQSPDFIKTRQEYYNNLDNSVRPSIKRDDKKINEIDKQINDPNSFIVKDKTGNTDVIGTITNILSAPLGNIETLMKKTNHLTSHFDKIPQILDSLKEKIKTGVIDPSAARLIAPLDKLYKSFMNKK